MSTSKNDKPDLFLQSVIDGVPDCILVIGPDYEVKLMNRAAREFSLKFSGAFQQCYKIFHRREKPCMSAGHNCPLEEVRKTGQPDRVVHEHYNSNGEKRSVEILSSPLYGADGTFHGIIQCSRDITMNTQAEKDLTATIAAVEDEKNKSEAIIAALGDGIIIQDTDYKIIYQNQVQNDLYGNRTGELCYRAYEGSDKICEDCPVEKTFGDGKIHRSERRIPTDKGVSYFELTSSPLKDSTGKITAGIKVVREITQRKHDEEELRESERFMDSIFASIQDGIGIIDKDMNIIRVNKTGESWYSHAMPLVGKKCYEAYHNRKEQCEFCPARKTLVTGNSAYKIVPKHGPGGKEVGWLEIYSYPLKDTTTGQMKGVIEYVRDITERKHIEEAIKIYNMELKESNRIKELFADIMHHDLLNPLNVAHCYVELFLEDETNHQKKSYLESIKRNLVKGMELIENATKFSKLESMKKIEFENLDLKMIVGEAIENLTPLAVKAGMSIENKLESSMPARANKIIEDIFINLISNAIKYAPEGKRIVVDGKDGGTFWIIRVIDFGAGIKDADKKMIFERFHREEKKGVKGSGLGLAIAGKIVELHKGRIWVEDNPEGGALFAVEIPKS